jgi:acetolactate synthase regulatory subunit
MSAISAPRTIAVDADAGRRRPRPVAAPPARTRRYAVETTGREDVLVRVLGLLRRRGCRIVAVDFHEADRHRPGRFDVCVELPPRTEHRIEAWLSALVDVVEVRSG